MDTETLDKLKALVASKGMTIINYGVADVKEWQNG
jgi:hypothetical protein